MYLCVNYFAKCATKFFPNMNDIGENTATLVPYIAFM